MSCQYLTDQGTCRAAAMLAGIDANLAIVEPATCARCGKTQDSQMVTSLAAMYSRKHGDGTFADKITQDRKRAIIKARERETEQALKDQARADQLELACVHRGEEIRTQPCRPCLGKKEIPVYRCNHPDVAQDECTISNHLIRSPQHGKKLPVCVNCEHLASRREEPNDKLDANGNPVQAHRKSAITPGEAGKFTVVIKSRPAKELQDITGFNRGPQVGGFLVNSIGVNADALEGQAHGASVFLSCGGPSLEDMSHELDLLYQRGIAVAAVNQCGATHVRPHYWFSVDEPLKFHPVIWEDPGVMKFLMRSRSRDQPRRKTGQVDSQGRPVFEQTGIRSRDYPNVWFFEHQMGMDLDGFLHMNPLTWGGDWDNNGRNRQTKSVMLVAIRMLYWLGFRRIYLLGCDFKMSPDRTYAFEEPKDTRASGYNNNSYEILNQWFQRLRPHFESHGLQILNATPGSQLTAFDKIRFRDAIARERLETPTDVRWYYIVGNGGG